MLPFAAQSTMSQHIETGFMNRSVTVSGVEYRYQVYVPREFSKSKKWPVIIALHGGGEYGNDGIRQTNGFLARAIRANPERVILTGLSAGGNGTWSLASRYPERFAAIVPVCGSIAGRKGGTSGIYYPALAPADAGDPYAFIAKKVATIPVWIFHGDADKSIPVEESRNMAAALRAIGANVQYTELPGVAHNAWDPAYARADLIEWMLKQRRP